MRCPKCSSPISKVTDSRFIKKENSVRRRRKCQECNYKYTTYEEIENLLTILEGEQKTLLKKEMLQQQLYPFFEGLPSIIKIPQIAKEIFEELSQEPYNEIPAEVLFFKTAAKIKDYEPIAFIRYFALQKQIGSIENFYQEITSFLKKTRKNENQKQLL